MGREFINPNWHVVLIHYPVALLSLGLLVEIVSFFKAKGGFRAAGRWMILLGALLAIPTLMSGLYAFRDVVTPDEIMIETPWNTLKQQSPWSQMQWIYMRRHIWCNSVGVGLFALVVAGWLSSGDRIRRRLYWPLLLVAITGNVLLGVGAWHGGEGVYRFGTAVGAGNTQRADGVTEWGTALQVHVILAGFAVAAAIVAVALMLRRWEKPVVDTEAHDRPRDPLAYDPARDRTQREPSSLGPFGEEEATVHVPPRVYPGWFYFATSVLALLTAFFGFWSVTGAVSGAALKEDMDLLKEAEHRRLLIHTILGALIVIVPLIIGLLVRFARRQRLVPAILTAASLVVVGLQIWLGVAMLYDGHEGPLFSFNPPTVEGATMEKPHEHEHQHQHEAAHAPSTTRAAATRRLE